MAFNGLASSTEYKKRLLNHFLFPDSGVFREEARDALGFDFLVVFVEPLSRPRLACGFDFFCKVFTAGNVSERCRPTSAMSQPINVDHQNENENQIILTLRLCLCQSWLLCSSKYQSNLSRRHTDPNQCNCFGNILKVLQEANILQHSLIYEERPNNHHNAWKYSIFVNYSCRRYKDLSLGNRRKR